MGVKSQRNDPDLDSPTVKFAGEPSTENLYTRFDEGRGGLAEWAGPLVYSIGLFLLHFLIVFRTLTRFAKHNCYWGTSTT